MTSPRVIDVLLVDDNPGDRLLTKLALESEKLVQSVTLHEASDGQSCLDFLNKVGEYQDKPRPDLILLDLNMPGIDGLEVLSIIKRSDEFKSIPVVILTSSDRDEDIADSYAMQAACFVRKPLDMTQVSKIISAIGEFWFAIVHFAPKHEDG